MDELDSLPTLEELTKAIDSLACAKASGNYAIPFEILKVGKCLFQPSTRTLTLVLE